MARRAPSHKQAKRSFIETHQTAYAFLRKTYEEPQITLLLEARNLAVDVKSVVRAVRDLVPAVNERYGNYATLPPDGGLVLRIPPSVQDNKAVQDTLAVAVRLADSLTDFAQVPAFRPIYIEWCSVRLFEKISLSVRRLDAEIILMIAKAAQIPLPDARQLAALAVLEPAPLEQPESRILLVKSRVDRWRYALISGDNGFVFELLLMRLLQAPRWCGTRPSVKSSPIGSSG